MDTPISTPSRIGAHHSGLWMKLGLAVFSTAVTLLLLELGVRVLRPVEMHPTDTYLAPVAADGGGPGGKAGAMLLVPGVSTREKTPEFDVPVRINSHGLRDREFSYEKPPEIYRVLVLGDSQTFGVGVPVEESYPKVLERLLRKATGLPVEVINSGVPGTGTAHQLYFLERQGWEYQPDAVVTGFFFNDVNNNALCHLYAVDNGRLARKAATDLDRGGELWKSSRGKGGLIAYHPADLKERSPSFLIRHSHLARLLRQSAANLKRRPFEEERAQRRAEGRELTAHLLGELSRQCRERGAVFITALIPSLVECDVKELHELAETNADLLTRVPPEEALDLMPAFQSAGYRPLFYPADQHMTAAGHRLAAELLAARLRRLDSRLK